MLTPSQITQLAELVNEADIDVTNNDEVNEFIGLLLEDVAGFECTTDDELMKVQSFVVDAINAEI